MKHLTMFIPHALKWVSKHDDDLEEELLLIKNIYCTFTECALCSASVHMLDHLDSLIEFYLKERKTWVCSKFHSLR